MMIRLLIFCFPIITLFANKAHCSWNETLRSYASKSPRPVVQAQKSPKGTVINYNQIPFLVNFDFACTVHAVPYTTEQYHTPSIAKQMDIENQKIALVLTFYGKKNPREKSFVVHPSGVVLHYHKPQLTPAQLVARNLAVSKSARSFFAR